MMGAPTVYENKTTESFLSRHIRPIVVILLNFTYVYCIIFKVPLPPMYETILVAVNLASFGGRTWEKIKKNNLP